MTPSETSASGWWRIETVSGASDEVQFTDERVRESCAEKLPRRLRGLTLVEVTHRSGNRSWINPDHVAYLIPATPERD